MLLTTSRFTLRDLAEGERVAFVAYQMDPRYRHLYDIGDGNESRAHDLFDTFVSWQQAEPRQNYQLGIFDRRSDRLCGVAGLRQAGQPDRTAVLGIELTPDDWGRYRFAIDVAYALIELGFGDIGLDTIIGVTASNNKRVEKLARWFGATVVACHADRNGSQIDWRLTRETWDRTRLRLSLKT